MKQGWGTSSMFKVFNLTYLHVLPAGMVNITQWYMHVPSYVLGQNLIEQPPLKLSFKGMCTTIMVFQESRLIYHGTNVKSLFSIFDVDGFIVAHLHIILVMGIHQTHLRN